MIGPAMVATARTPQTPAISGQVPSSQYTFHLLRPWNAAKPNISTHCWLQPTLFEPQNKTPGQSMSQRTRTPCSRLVSPLKYISDSSSKYQRRLFPRQCHNSLAKHLLPNTTLPLFHSLLSSGYELTAVLLPHCLPHIPNLPPMPHQHSDPAIPSPSSC